MNYLNGKQFIILLFISLISISPISAYASSIGMDDLYLIGGFGQTKQKTDTQSGIDQRLSINRKQTFSNTEKSFRIGVGTEVNKKFFVEAYYMKYNKIKSSNVSSKGQIYSATIKTSMETTLEKTFAIQGLYKFSLQPDLNFYGKLGWIRADAKFDEINTSPSLSGNESHKNKSEGSTFFYGVGIEKTFSKKYTFRFEYEKIKFGITDGGSIKLDTLSVNYIHKI